MGIKIGPVWCRSCEPSARRLNLTYVAVRHDFVGAMFALHLKKRGNWRSDKSVTRYEEAVRCQAKNLNPLVTVAVRAFSQSEHLGLDFAAS